MPQDADRSITGVPHAFKSAEPLYQPARFFVQWLQTFVLDFPATVELVEYELAVAFDSNARGRHPITEELD